MKMTRLLVTSVLLGSLTLSSPLSLMAAPYGGPGRRMPTRHESFRPAPPRPGYRPGPAPHHNDHRSSRKKDRDTALKVGGALLLLGVLVGAASNNNNNDSSTYDAPEYYDNSN